MKYIDYDKELNIDTSGIRHWDDTSLGYYMYEATPYEALDYLCTNLEVGENSTLVDFGCGKGRVPFYFNNKYGIPVRGIEYNKDTYNELMVNKEGYLNKSPSHLAKQIKFYYMKAEDYSINEDEDIFYFFNPFSVDIFKKVVSNILANERLYPRDLRIILFYPYADYENFLKNSTPFHRIKKLAVPRSNDINDRFAIYCKNKT